MSTLTTREQQLIAMGLQCYDTQPKIDYAKLAELSGLKNGSTASVMYGNAKRKLLGIAPKAGGPSTPGKGGDITADGDGSEPLDSITPTTTPKKKATPRKRKTATPKAGGEATGENGEEGSTETTPKPKRVRKTPAKKAAKTPVKVKEDNSETDAAIEGLDEDIVKDEPTDASGVEATEPKLEEAEDSDVKIEVVE